MTDISPTYRTLITNFADFLTVAIHTILYERSIYPQTSFLSTRKYNYAVRQNRHPKVCSWINDAVAAVEGELLKGTVERVAVVIYSKEDMPLERFMFDVSRFSVVPLKELDTPMERTNADGERVPVLPIVDLEEQLRATMSRLSTCGSVLKPVPSNCTFNIAIELKDESEPPIGHPQPWIPVQPGLQKNVVKAPETVTKIGHEVGGIATTPLRAVEAGEMIFETWIEEGRAKLEQSVRSSNSTVQSAT